LPTDDLEPVDVGQHHVEDEQVEGVVPDQAERVRPVLRDGHLEAEEAHALPLLQRHFSTDEIDAVGDAHLAKNADKLNVMIPWAATALPTEATTQLLAGMPPAVQESFSKWSLAFQQRFAPLLGANAHAVAA